MRGLRRLDLEEEAQLAKAMSNGGLVEVRSGVSMARGEKNRMAELCSEESFDILGWERGQLFYVLGNVSGPYVPLLLLLLFSWTRTRTRTCTRNLSPGINKLSYLFVIFSGGNALTLNFRVKAF